MGPASVKLQIFRETLGISVEKCVELQFERTIRVLQLGKRCIISDRVLERRPISTDTTRTS